MKNSYPNEPEFKIPINRPTANQIYIVENPILYTATADQIKNSFDRFAGEPFNWTVTDNDWLLCDKGFFLSIKRR